MKRILYLSLSLFVCLFASQSVSAQDKSSTNLHFVYLAHEVTTPVTELCSKIRSLQEDAMDVDDALILYLSDGRTSLTSFTNLKDEYGKNRDNRNAFDEIIAALEDANSHDVIAATDISNILQLFEEYNFINSDGSFVYNSVTFDFYVGTNFWSLGNNEKVIAHLFEAFSMKSLPKDKFTINIFKPRTDHPKYPEGKPFGDNNVEGINQVVRIMDY